MPVTVRKMTDAEFSFFYNWSIRHQTEALMAQLHIPRETALKETVAEIDGMLPQGLHTRNNTLLTVIAEDQNVGFIWTLYEETQGRKQCFVCDFAIWETQRRKGYGKAALYLAEQLSAAEGCLESILFVSDDNSGARALYEACGYRTLRREGCGEYMHKPLSP